MNQLTFIEKINVLFKMLFSSPIIIGIFVFSMILMILLFFYSKLNKKIMKFIFIIIYMSLIGFAVFKYGKYFLTSIDSFVTLFMANIYFPIIPVYVGIMLISFIIMIVTLSSKNKHRIVKIINTVFFTFIQMLFALFIYTVESNKIDISTNTNLYSNEQTMTLLELGMGLFVVWIIILIVIFYLKKADVIFKTKPVEETDDFDEYINDYNENTMVFSPITSNVVDTSFNNSVVETLVPNIEPIEEEVISFDDEPKEEANPIVPEVVQNNYVNEIQNNYVNDAVPNVMPVNDFVPEQKVVSTTKNVQGNSSLSVFDNFEFLDVSKYKVERKSEDVEIIDL